MNNTALKNIIQALLILLGFSLIIFGTYLNSQLVVWSNILIGLGSSLIGASISNIINKYNTESYLNVISTLLSNEITSEEKEIKLIRDVYFFYWKTTIENKPTWFMARIDFGKIKLNRVLSSDYSVFTRGGKKIGYYVNAGIRSNKLVMLIKAKKGNEPYIIGVFPKFGFDYTIKNFGILFNRTYDKTDVLVPSILSSKNLIKQKKFTEVNVENQKILEDLWTTNSLSIYDKKDLNPLITTE